MSDTITFAQHSDGRVTADRFPETICVAPELLAVSDPNLMRRAGDRLYFTLANGEATYVIRNEGENGLLFCDRLTTRGPDAS